MESRPQFSAKITQIAETARSKAGEGIQAARALFDQASISYRPTRSGIARAALIATLSLGTAAPIAVVGKGMEEGPKTESPADKTPDALTCEPDPRIEACLDGLPILPLAPPNRENAPVYS